MTPTRIKVIRLYNHLQQARARENEKLARVIEKQLRVTGGYDWEKYLSNTTKD